MTHQNQSMLKTMDQCNVKLIIFCGHEALHALCTEHQLDIKAVRKYPDRFKAYFALNGNRADQKTALKRLQTHRDVFVGLKTLGSYFHHPIFYRNGEILLARMKRGRPPGETDSLPRQ